MSMVCGTANAVSTARQLDNDRSLNLGSKIKDELSLLERRVGKTYRAHLVMAKRLQRRDRYWTFALICLSVTSTLSSVALLTDSTIYGANGATRWTLMGVGTLAVSLVLANADYRTRSEEAFRAYRQLQRLWARLDYQSQQLVRRSSRKKCALEGDASYQGLLDSMPNHSPSDYYSSVRIFTKGDAPYDKNNAEHEVMSRSDVTSARAQQIASAAGTGVPLLISGLSVLSLAPVIVFFTNA